MFESPAKKGNENKNEKKLIWKGTAGFDFIFVHETDVRGRRRRVPYLVEVNGTNSGFGMRKIPKGGINHLRQLFANIRGYSDTIDEDVVERRKKYLKFDESYRDLITKITGQKEDLTQQDIGEYLLETQKHVAMNRWVNHGTKFGNVNVPALEDIFDDKFFQKHFMRGIKTPRVYAHTAGFRNDNDPSPTFENEDDELRTTNSKTGKWIVKPIFGAKGEDIEVVDDEVFSDPKYKDYVLKDKVMRIFQEKYGDKYKWDDLIVEEYLPALGALQEMSTDLKDNPASLRLILDYGFYINKDGTTEVVVEYSDGFQRVSQTIGKKDSGIVNSSHGALSRRASDYEIETCFPVAKEYIQRINNYCFDAIFQIAMDNAVD